MPEKFDPLDPLGLFRDILGKEYHPPVEYNRHIIITITPRLDRAFSFYQKIAFDIRDDIQINRDADHEVSVDISYS